jgi:hypothetical protein
MPIPEATAWLQKMGPTPASPAWTFFGKVFE